MTPAQCFVELFSNMHMVTVCLWITGLILFCVEFFQPMHGVAYGVGIGLIAAAIVTRAVNGSAGIVFMFVLITAALLFAVHCVSLVTQKREWLKVARIEKAGARTRKYDMLMGAVGIANTPIDLTGNVTINDINIVVYSETPIERGAAVRVMQITPDKIIVERVDD